MRFRAEFWLCGQGSPLAVLIRVQVSGVLNPGLPHSKKKVPAPLECLSGPAVEKPGTSLSAGAAAAVL